MESQSAVIVIDKDDGTLLGFSSGIPSHLAQLTDILQANLDALTSWEEGWLWSTSGGEIGYIRRLQENWFYFEFASSKD